MSSTTGSTKTISLSSLPTLDSDSKGAKETKNTRRASLNQECSSELNIPSMSQGYFCRGTVQAYVGDLSFPLLEFIQKSDAIVGCAAWLTSHSILEALKFKRAVSFIVQKEDFLRPSSISKERDRLWRSQLRRAYDALPCWTVLNGNGTPSDQDLSPAIRCLGMHKMKRHRHEAAPLLHHKFLIRGRQYSESHNGSPPNNRLLATMDFEPMSVWTGSCNLTNNSKNSRENALLIEDKELAMFYFIEWARMWAISECVDWRDEAMTRNNGE